MRAMTRIIGIIFVLSILTSVFAACKKNGTENVDTTSDDTKADVSDVGTEDNREYDDKGYLKDTVGEQDFGGKEIRILGWSERYYKEFGIKPEDVQETTLGQQVYKRDLQTQKRLNVKLAVVTEAGNNGNYKKSYIPKAETMVTGNEVDAFACYSMAATPLMLRGYLVNLLDQPYLNFDDPWWSADIVERASIYDRLYFATGSISPSYLAQGFSMYFNKSMADTYLTDALESFDAETLYDMVDNNTWTIDNFITLAKTVEISGAEKTADETYGYVLRTVSYDPWLFSAGIVTLDNAVDGSLQISEGWNSSKVISLAEKLLSLLNSKSGGAAVDRSSTSYTFESAWKNGRSLFMTSSLYDLTTWVKNENPVTEDGVGILPMPKWDSTQTDYLSTAGFYFTLWGICRSSDRQDATAATLEVLSSEGYRTTEPALYDEVLKIKSTDGAGSSNDRRMIDFVRDSIVIDAGRIHNNDIHTYGWGMFRNSIMDDIINGSSASSYSTFFASRNEQLRADVNTLNSTMQMIEEVYG